MNILGISAFYHDSAACLVKDGVIIAAAQEERWTRKKHDLSFPAQATAYCLAEGGLTPGDLDLIAFYDKPLLKFDRLLETYLSFAPEGLKSYLTSMPQWLKHKLWLPEIFSKELDYQGKLIFIEHHQSHAASAFFPSPFGRAAILTLDGVGEWTTTSFGVGQNNHIKILAELKFPHSLGLLYSAFTYFTGFKVNSGEYKLMGLAPYGEPRFADVILSKLMSLKEDGSFKLNLEYFNYCQGLTMTNDRFARLFGGPPRRLETPLTQREMDLAASMQQVTEEVVMRITRHLHRQTGEENLVLAGGVALNCVANGRVLKEGPFKQIWIQPAAGDAGGALGAALFAWHQYLNRSREMDGNKDLQQGSYLGIAFSDEEIETFMKSRKIPYHRLKDADLPLKAAQLIAAGKVVGWFQGRMEFGPRALGSRSILGDARNPQMQSTINLKIKFRESFRPFAPSVLMEEVGNYFEMDRPSPYMLLAANVLPKLRRELTPGELDATGLEKLKVVRSSIPAVTHVDSSARLQTVHKDTNPLYHRLLKAFKDLTGCGVIVNTSFNVRGEPIVCTPEHAYTCFMRTGMDALFLGHFLLDKADQPAWELNEDWQQQFEIA